MAAIGDGWATDAWVEAGWITGAWATVVAAVGRMIVRIRRRRRR